MESVEENQTIQNELEKNNSIENKIEENTNIESEIENSSIENTQVNEETNNIENKNEENIIIEDENKEINQNENPVVESITIEEKEEIAIQQELPIIGSIANALKSDLKAQVETVLFVTDKPMKTGEISKILNAAYDDVQSALVQLIQEYEDRNGGLEIGTDEGYIIQIKAQYLNIVTDMMPLEISAGPLRTLSAIALKEPCLQSEIVDMRGSSAYDHISELVEMDLVSKKPQGLSYILKTTQKFQTYFRLSPEANKIKEKLQEQATRLAKEKAEKELAMEMLDAPSIQDNNLSMI